MILGNNWTFLQSFFLGKTRREKLCNDLLDRIIAFLDNKTNNIKGRKICIFPKGLVHGFGEKLAISFTFRFRQNVPKKTV